MQEYFIEGYGDHERFDAVKTGNSIEFCVVGSEETVIEVTTPDGNKRMMSMKNADLREGILSGRLSHHLAEKWLIQREEDKKYYTSSHRWSSDIDKALRIDFDRVDEVVRVMVDRNYKAFKVKAV